METHFVHDEIFHHMNYILDRRKLDVTNTYCLKIGVSTVIEKLQLTKKNTKLAFNEINNLFYLTSCISPEKDGFGKCIASYVICSARNFEGNGFIFNNVNKNIGC